MEPVRLGRYLVGRLLGRGGSGQVYQATWQGPAGLRTEVALKVLEGDGGGLRREARLGGLLRHRNLVDVFEVGQHEGRWFLVMELCPDGTLERPEPLPPRAVVEVGLQVCAALEYAHQSLGLVHLDLKPGNLLLSGDTVKVADLGISWARGFHADQGVRGTPGFVAPEVLAGSVPDARADIYGLGVVLERLATGTAAGDTADWSTVGAPEQDEGAPRGAWPDWLSAVLDRALQADPEQRFASMREVAEALARLEVDGPGLAEALGVRHEPVASSVDDPQATPLLGREEDLALIARALERPGLVTLKGPGGIGKTRLARRAAHRWCLAGGHEGWFVDLQRAQRPIDVVAAVSQALDLRLDRLDDAGLASVGAALASRGPCVLVLDNLEQVETPGVLLSALRDAAPQARLLATSRARLEADGRLLEVGPLPEDPAVALICARALARGQILDPSDPVLAALAARLDGLPLALELAAGRLGVMAAAEVLERLELPLLRTGEAVPERHETLQATLDWSWALCSEEARRALARLAVFPGSFTPAAAQAALGLPHPERALTVLDDLADRSLLSARDGRLTLMASVRAYAGRHLSEDGEVMERVIAHYAELGAPESLARHATADAPTMARLVREERPNLEWAADQAARRGHFELAARAARAAAHVVLAVGPVAEAQQLAERVLLALPPEVPARIGLHLDAGRACHVLGEPERARAHFDAAHDLATRHDLVPARAEAVVALAGLDFDRRDRGALEDKARRALALATPVAPHRVSVHLYLGSMAREDADYPRAWEHDRLADAYARQLGSPKLRALVLRERSLLRSVEGDLEGARRDMVEAITACRVMGDLRTEGALTTNLALVDANAGDRERALEGLTHALALHRSMGNVRSEIIVEYHLGRLQVDRDREAAEPHLRRCITLATDRAMDFFAASAHLELARAAAQAPLRPEACRHHAAEAKRLYGTSPWRLVVDISLSTLWLAEGHPRAALELLEPTMAALARELPARGQQALPLLALCLAEVGELEGARAALEGCDPEAYRFAEATARLSSLG